MVASANKHSADTPGYLTTKVDYTMNTADGTFTDPLTKPLTTPPTSRPTSREQSLSMCFSMNAQSTMSGQSDHSDDSQEDSSLRSPRISPRTSSSNVIAPANTTTTDAPSATSTNATTTIQNGDKEQQLPKQEDKPKQKDTPKQGDEPKQEEKPEPKQEDEPKEDKPKLEDEPKQEDTPKEVESKAQFSLESDKKTEAQKKQVHLHKPKPKIIAEPLTLSSTSGDLLKTTVVNSTVAQNVNKPPSGPKPQTLTGKITEPQNPIPKTLVVPDPDPTLVLASIQDPVDIQNKPSTPDLSSPVSTTSEVLGPAP
eukprot:gene20948-7811_t